MQQAGSDSAVWLTGLGSTQDLPRPGMEPVSPISAGGFLTTGSPGSLGKSTFKRLLMVQKCRIEKNKLLRHLNFSTLEIKVYKIIITLSL